jgi:hypothetical protein
VPEKERAMEKLLRMLKREGQSRREREQKVNDTSRLYLANVILVNVMT